MTDEGSDMAYRLCEIDRSGYSSMPARELMFGSDAEAIANVERRLDGKVVDIWQDARLVARLEPAN